MSTHVSVVDRAHHWRTATLGDAGCTMTGGEPSWKYGGVTGETAQAAVDALLTEMTADSGRALHRARRRPRLPRGRHPDLGRPRVRRQRVHHRRDPHRRRLRGRAARPTSAAASGSHRRTAPTQAAAAPDDDLAGRSGWRSTGSLLPARRGAPSDPRRASRSASRVASSSAAAPRCAAQRVDLVLELEDPAHPLDADAGRGELGDLAEQVDVAGGVAAPAAAGAAGRDQAHPLVGAQGLRVQPGQLGGDADDEDGRVGLGRSGPASRRFTGMASLGLPRTGWTRSVLPSVAAR